MNLPGHSNHCRCGACTHDDDSRSLPLLSLCDITLQRDDRTILTDVNFTVDRGDFIAITGPNGGGKTTLLRIILGLIKPTKGYIEYFDEEGNPSKPPLTGYLPQKNSVDSHFPITVNEVVSSGLLAAAGMDRKAKEDRVSGLLEMVGLSDRRDQSIGSLSGGQLQRALFARAIAIQPKLLILDEPLSYLDKVFEARLYDILRELAKDTTIMLVSHEMSEIGAMATRHILVDHSLEECPAKCHNVHRDC